MERAASAYHHLRTATEVEGVLAWAAARRGNLDDAQTRLAKLRKAAADDDSETAQFSLLGVEASVAAASGNWQRAIELRRQTVRMATAWNARGLRIEQQAHLADALHGAGEHRAVEKLVSEMLPEVDRLGLRGIAHDLRDLLAKESVR